MGILSTNETLDDAVARLGAAASAFVRGDSAQYEALWSHREDVCLMSAYGGIAIGWSQAAPRIARAAAHHAAWSNGVVETRTLLTAVDGDLATLVREEVMTDLGSHGAVQEEHRRLTLGLRKENGRWLIYHQHSDSLVVPAH